MRTEFTSSAIGQEQKKGVEASQREIPVHSADILLMLAMEPGDNSVAIGHLLYVVLELTLVTVYHL